MSMNIGKHTQELTKEMELKNYSNLSIKLYTKSVESFLNHFEQSYNQPKDISVEKIKEWLLNSQSIATFKIRLSSLKFFYIKVVRQPLKFKYIEYPRSEKKHHILFSVEEINKLISVCDNKKHRCIILVAYSTGIRVSELLNIKISDLDRGNGVIHILHGKGNTSRQVTMNKLLLDIIDDYILAYNPNEYLFCGQSGGRYTSSSINNFLKSYAKKAGITKNIHIHLLRHQYATNCLDNGENIHITQMALGHRSPNTTAKYYYHLTSKVISNAYSPINSIFVL